MSDLQESLEGGNQDKTKLGDVIIMSSEALESQTRAEVDYQVATAKQYPRNLKSVLKNIEFLATQDQETAESCFYAIKRDGKTITGATVRLAEIISSQWGNLRSQASIIANDGRTITAKGQCWDLESNVAYSVEVRRKITTTYGTTYSEDMQIVSANAACSIALRNAVFKCIPMAITRKIQDKIKDVMLGDEDSFEEIKQKALKHFVKQGIKKGQLLKLLERETVEDINRDDVFILRGLATAIEDGDTTLASAFSTKTQNKKGSMSSKLAMDEEDEEEEVAEETEIVSESEGTVQGFAVESESKKDQKKKPAAKKP